MDPLTLALARAKLQPEISSINSELNRFLARQTLQRSGQAMSPEVTLQTQVGALSADVLDGLMGKVVAKSRTITNRITNGDLSSGTTGWVGNNTNLSATGGVLSIIGVGTGSSASAYQQTGIPFVVSSKVYVRARCRVTNAVCTKARLTVADASGANSPVPVDQNAPTNGAWYGISGLFVLPANSTNLRVYLQHFYVDAPTQNEKVMEVQEIMAVEAISLPPEIQALSDANIKAYCDLLPFITGTRSTPPQRVRCVGENLERIARVETTGSWAVAYGAVIPVVPNMPIYLYQTVTGSYRPYFKFLDKSGVPIVSGITITAVGWSLVGGAAWSMGTNSTSSRLASVSAHPDIYFVQMGVGTGNVVGTVVATERLVSQVVQVYVPYIESTAHAYPPGLQLRKVGSGADEIDLLSGAHTKRISDLVTIMPASIGALVTSTTNYDAVVFDKSILPSAGTWTTGLDGFVNVTGWAEISSVGIPDETASVGRFYTTASQIGFLVAKGSYSSLTNARANFPQQTAIYQLGTPVVSNLRYHLMNAYANGSIIVEPMLIGTKKPDTATGKLAISDSTLPASGIEQVLRHDVQVNGVLVETDVTASCALADSGASIAITGVDTTKVYTYRAVIDSRYNPGCDLVYKAPVGVARHDYAAAATAWVLSADEIPAGVLYCIGAGGAADIIAPAKLGAAYTLINASGQTLTIKKSGGTGVALGTGKTARIAYNGSDYVFVAASNA